MKQVLSNIISNAIKYCKIKIGITLNVDENNMMRTASGTGVGLYVVKELCDIMGYQVSIGRSNNFGGAKVSIKGKIK